MRYPLDQITIVGEPTGMNPAVAEKGLMVLDVIAHGKSGVDAMLITTRYFPWK